MEALITVNVKSDTLSDERVRDIETSIQKLMENYKTDHTSIEMNVEIKNSYRIGPMPVIE